MSSPRTYVQSHLHINLQVNPTRKQTDTIVLLPPLTPCVCRHVMITVAAPVLANG